MNVAMHSNLAVHDLPPALHALADTEPGLAAEFRAGWDVPAATWAARQWQQAPRDAAFELAFRGALVAELAERGDLDSAGAEALVSRVEAGGAVLTPHHVCPTPGPTFGAIDWLAAQGSPGPILVLAWSGVPMSNSACSSALCFTASPFEALLVDGPELHRQRKAARDRARDGVVQEQRITLVPSPLRDALLYECPAPDRLHEVFTSTTDALRAQIVPPAGGERYPAWAVRAAEHLQRNVVGRNDLFYVDLNRVGRRYLLEVLDRPDHPVTRLLGSAAAPDDLAGTSWFYGRRPGKREKVRTFDGPPPDLEELREGLVSGAICPGLVPIFGALRLCSRIRLLGGFRQVCYLEDIAAAWRRLGVVDAGSDPLGGGGVPGGLLTGRLTVEGAPVYPLDLALGTVPRDALPAADTPMSSLWEPLLPRVQERAR